jgi:hypothetical protein
LWHWRKGRRRPGDLAAVERVLFGDNDAYAQWRHELRQKYEGPRQSRQVDNDHFLPPVGIFGDKIEDQTEQEPELWEIHLSDDHQSHVGGRWVEQDDKLALDLSGNEQDEEVAESHLVRQLHDAVLRKAKHFSECAIRPDNAYGWHGISAAAKRFCEVVSRETSDIPAVMGYLYDAIVELGSYLEQDNQVRARGRSDIDALDEEVAAFAWRPRSNSGSMGSSVSECSRTG